MKSLSIRFVLALSSVLGLVACVAQPVDSQGSGGGAAAVSTSTPDSTSAPDEQVGHSEDALMQSEEPTSVCSHCPKGTDCCIEAGEYYRYEWCARPCVFTN